MLANRVGLYVLYASVICNLDGEVNIKRNRQAEAVVAQVVVPGLMSGGGGERVGGEEEEGGEEGGVGGEDEEEGGAPDISKTFEPLAKDSLSGLEKEKAMICNGGDKCCECRLCFSSKGNCENDDQCSGSLRCGTRNCVGGTFDTNDNCCEEGKCCFRYVCFQL